MTTCLVCGMLCDDPVCGGCRASLGAVPERRLPGGLVVRAALAHRGPARVLVRRLKYEGILRAADTLAARMVPLLPEGAGALVPVPRVRLRRWRYGVDPARELARALSRRTGFPVAEVLVAGWWAPARAGRGRSNRPVPAFGRTGSLPGGAVLVDDVVTTGATLSGAARVCGWRVAGAVAATGAGEPPGWTGYHEEHGRNEIHRSRMERP